MLSYLTAPGFVGRPGRGVPLWSPYQARPTDTSFSVWHLLMAGRSRPQLKSL